MFSDKAKAAGRWTDNRYPLITELPESGTGNEMSMRIAGLVSRTSVWADEKRGKEGERQQNAASPIFVSPTIA